MSVIFPLPSEAAYLERDDDSDIIPSSARPVVGQVPVVVLPKMPKKKQQSPQEAINEFWDKFSTKAPGKG
jgi:hypothetical protein